jgi:L-seryl-tRNA(Ser) seleniumtransferase
LDKSALLRQLPQVDELLRHPVVASLLAEQPRRLVLSAVRETIAARRQAILDGQVAELGEEALAAEVTLRVQRSAAPRLRPVLNATGVVVHTNLGRSILAEEAVSRVMLAASSYTNLEFDLDRGERGSRHSLTEELLCTVTGAEAGFAVNNNAAAVFLVLAALAAGREVIVSRGELVEIGGSFRIPDVMAASGAILREVGTTNRTHLADYERATCPETAMLLKVHQSNFAVVGFTAQVSLIELAALGRERNIPVVEDLGSGSLIDFARFGLKSEPTVQGSLAAGADLVTFSGDKVLGGPQAGIIVGRKHLVETLKRHPLARALRLDKMTLAALEATLRLYLDEAQAVATIPTLRMIVAQESLLLRRARTLARLIRRKAPHLKVKVVDSAGRVGGGALPLEELPGKALALSHPERSAADLEASLRRQEPPLIGRIEHDTLLLDVRTLDDSELALVAEVVARA